MNLIRQHDVFFTLGEEIGRRRCPIPAGGLTWHPTRQPIVLANWPVRAAPDGPFTTAEGAVAALAAIRADYARACRHAREVAEAHFRAEDVCARLLADAGL